MKRDKIVTYVHPTFKNQKHTKHYIFIFFIRIVRIHFLDQQCVPQYKSHVYITLLYLLSITIHNIICAMIIIYNKHTRAGS